MPGKESWQHWTQSSWRNLGSVSGGGCGGIDGFWGVPKNLQCSGGFSAHHGSGSGGLHIPLHGSFDCLSLFPEHPQGTGWVTPGSRSPYSDVCEPKPHLYSKKPTNISALQSVESWGGLEPPPLGNTELLSRGQQHWTLPRLSWKYFMKNLFAKNFSPEKQKSLRKER